MYISNRHYSGVALGVTLAFVLERRDKLLPCHWICWEEREALIFLLLGLAVNDVALFFR
jgi:disulfide bond formation protein DsbB